MTTEEIEQLQVYNPETNTIQPVLISPWNSSQNSLAIEIVPKEPTVKSLKASQETLIDNQVKTLQEHIIMKDEISPDIWYQVINHENCSFLYKIYNNASIRHDTKNFVCISEKNCRG